MSGRKTILCVTCDEVLQENTTAEFEISDVDGLFEKVKSVKIWYCKDCKDFTLTANASARLLRAGIVLANKGVK